MPSFDEIMTTQKTFRTLLQAMSRPGQVYRLERVAEIKSGSVDHPHLFSVLLTLLDQEVGFCLVGPEKENLQRAVSELTRCPVKDLSDADFIAVLGGESRREILRAKRGTLEYPDTGATVIYQVEFLEEGNNGKPTVRLKGPGIRQDRTAVIQGLGKNELSDLRDVNSEYPLGIDCIFVDRTDRLMCIPRSTRIEVL
jgi:alpha-D-ribose 1-methylphosphonate 5-triphosphate synthase subunit PhnH